jgi:hypothetical protein
MSCARAESLTSGNIIISADPCKDNTFARIEAYLTNFFDRLSKIQGAVDNLQNEIRSVVKVIGDTITGFVNKILGSLNDKIAELIPKAIQAFENFLLGTGRTPVEIIAIETPLIPAVKKLLDGIFCAATKVMKGAKDALTDLITGAVKNVLNASACVVENIIGGFTNNLINTIDSIVGPLLGPITGILGTFFKFDLKNFLLTGINAVRKIQNLFECDEEKICPASTKYKIDQGPLKDMSEEDQDSAFNKVFSGVALSQGAKNLQSDFEKKYGKWSVFGAPLGEASDLGPCNFGNVTECGLPTATIFGGDGFGAAGNVILGKIIENVDTEDAVGSVIKTGSIVGVDITNPGQGYTDTPLISFQDGCNKGYGAYGRCIVDRNPFSPTYGQITGVTIISEGENYPAEIDELPLYIKSVVIEDPGSNYEEDDTVEGLDLTIRDGRVVAATIKPGFGYNGLPDLNINSDTGFGAVLRPIMTVATPQTEIVQVIDCVSR